MTLTALPARDTQLVQIVDAALADAARRSGDWLLCRPGCSQCCHGVFGISQLDAARLRAGMAELEGSDPDRAARIRERAKRLMARLRPDFPGNTKTGLLDESEEGEKRFAGFASDEPCPALNPQTGGCEVYPWRPIICRTFGPPVQSEEGLAVCELCYHGATDEQIAKCEMVPDPEGLEPQLVEEVESNSGVRGATIIAHCLAEPEDSDH